ncbi:unnamed protein product [Rotaria sp. Silwood1]|nr:unnamed protein product [Rotaria sp. Silwood1]
MVWLDVCSKGVTPLVVLDQGTVDHVEYIQKVLPIALKYGNETFGEHWAFQQNNKDHWPPNNPDLNPLDYCIWDEFMQCVNWEKVTLKPTLIDK